MTNIRTTLVAALGTVETTAQSATKLVATTGKAIDMLDRYVGEHQYKQALRIAQERQTYRKELLNRTTMAIAQEEHKIQEQLNSNPDLKSKFESNYKELEAILKATEEKLNA